METARDLFGVIYEKFRVVCCVDLGDPVLIVKKYFVWLATKRNRHKLEWVVLANYMAKLTTERGLCLVQIAKMMGTPELFPYISRAIMPGYKPGTSGFKLRKALRDNYALLDQKPAPALTLHEFIAEQGILYGINPRLTTEVPYEIEVYREWDKIAYNEARVQNIFTFKGVVPIVTCTPLMRVTLVDTLIKKF